MWYKNSTTIKLKDYISHDSKILLVIAHPDDEAMFFGPLLIASQKELSQISILCLSNGNYEGLGSIRSKELVESGNIFSIPKDKITIIDNNRLQDGMNNNWPVDIIADIVIEHSNGINTIITFDEYGVSGHPNHISTYKGVNYALSLLQENRRNNNNNNNKIIGLKLDSTIKFRKYLGVFDIIFSLLFSNFVIFNIHIFLIWFGMRAHYSQFVWYRKLFILFSRYTYINSFSKITC